MKVDAMDAWWIEFSKAEFWPVSWKHRCAWIFSSFSSSMVLFFRGTLPERHTWFLPSNSLRCISWKARHYHDILPQTVWYSLHTRRFTNWQGWIVTGFEFGYKWRLNFTWFIMNNLTIIKAEYYGCNITWIILNGFSLVSPKVGFRHRNNIAFQRLRFNPHQHCVPNTGKASISKYQLEPSGEHCHFLVTIS